jgi:hypothetical protein
LTSHFGNPTECFRFTGKLQWIVVFSNQVHNPAWSESNPSVPPQLPAPFGSASIAIETCSASDQSCLNASQPQDFSNFTVYPVPPEGLSNLPNATDVPSTFGGQLLWVTPGHCKPMLFDVTKGTWYPSTESSQPSDMGPQVLAILNNSGPSTFSSPMPQPMPGNVALATTTGAPQTSGTATTAAASTTQCPS